MDKFINTKVISFHLPYLGFKQTEFCFGKIVKVLTTNKYVIRLDCEFPTPAKYIKGGRKDGWVLYEKDLIFLNTTKSFGPYR